MVTLPEISTYSDKQIDELKKYSPISEHYLQLITQTSQNFSDQIRIKKHQHWLKCALATFHQKESPENICKYWSEETDKILEEAWNHCEIPMDSISLLAYGKLGSMELNLSSDIDVVFVKSNGYKDEGAPTKIRNFIKILSENTKFGFAYRVDLNLRPGGGQSPLVPQKAFFYNFYDEYLEAWHRLSFIRLRTLFETSKLDTDIESYCKKRCFPKRLDFSVINEIKNVRSKINFQWRKANEPLDLKLHPGGIRDIELYIHSLQVIYGGRNQKVQISSMTPAVRNLQLSGALSKEDAEFLLEFYWKLRQLENLIHIQGDQHTYLLQPETFKKSNPFPLDESDILKNLEKASKIVSSFFVSNETQKTESNEYGKTLNETSHKAIEEIKNLKSPLIKKQRIDKLKNEILHSFLEHSEKIDIDPNLAIQLFKDFIFSIKSKTSIFHLLSRHPKLLEDLAWMFSISPLVGQILSRRPELMDSFALGQVDFNENDDIEILWENLLDYKLLGHLNATVELIRTKDLQKYLTGLSDQADFIVEKLQSFLSAKFDSSPLEILCMGKWSGHELGIKSDLDFVFISDEPATQNQVKMARRLINLLTSHSSAGRLYDIDLRLKPNQSAGPLIIEKEKLYDFLNGKAEAWQKLAYLRSRLLGSQKPFMSEMFSSLKLTSEDLPQLEEILGKLLKSKSDSLDIKYASGGLLHTEFMTQMKCLLGERVPSKCSTASIIHSLDMNETDKTKVAENYELLRVTEQIIQICNQSTSTKVSKVNIDRPRITKILGRTNLYDSLFETLNDQTNKLKSLDLNY